MCRGCNHNGGRFTLLVWFLVKEPVVVLIELPEEAGDVGGGELVDVLLLLLVFELRAGQDDALQLWRGLHQLQVERKRQDRKEI